MAVFGVAHVGVEGCTWDAAETVARGEDVVEAVDGDAVAVGGVEGEAGEAAGAGPALGGGG